MLQYILALILGILLGTITGITPGLHINLLSAILLSSSAYLLKFATPLTISVTLASMSITHVFIEILPATFLSAPEPETSLAVLPAHKLLLEGKAYTAVYLAAIGSFTSLILISALFPLLIIIFKFVYPVIQPLTPYLLSLILVLLVLKEKNKFWAVVIILLAGALGIAVFNLNLNQPLLPLLAGLFGIGTLAASIKNKVFIPEQTFTVPKIKFKFGFMSVLSSIFSGTLCAFLPGIGPAQAAAISSIFTKADNLLFLITIGGISTVNMVLSFLTIYAISKARNGSIVAISELIPYFTVNHLIFFTAISLITASLALPLTLCLAKLFSRIIPIINYNLLCIAIICFIALLALIITGPLGLLVLVVSAATGILPRTQKVSQSHLMASLIIPVIFYYLI